MGRYVLLASQSISIGRQTLTGVSSGGGGFYTALLVKKKYNNQFERVIKPSFVIWTSF
jgi:hypothetical protein